MSSLQNKSPFKLHDFGLIKYDDAFIKQMQALEEVLSGGDPQILLCEHPAVITCGRLSDLKNIWANDEELRQKSVSLKYIDRGGDVTLHAPGQLVIYPIINLKNFKKDLHYYLHQLEEVAIALLNDFDIVGQRHPTQTGVWVDPKKIVSIGIGVKQWVTYHGIGVNVNTDLNLFSLINPCGLSVEMTSMAQCKGAVVDMNEVKKKVLNHFNRIFLQTNA